MRIEMSFKDFLKACSEETNSGDIASVDTTICDSSKKPRCLTKRKTVKEGDCKEGEDCNKGKYCNKDMEDDMDKEGMDKEDDMEDDEEDDDKDEDEEDDDKDDDD